MPGAVALATDAPAMSACANTGKGRQADRGPDPMQKSPLFQRAASLASAALLLLLCSCATTAALAANTGEQKTAVILVNFQDGATQPITPAAAHALVFGTVSDFYWEASYQKTFFSGDTFGWFTIPVSSTGCDVDAIAREADKAAAAAGANLAAYSRLVYLFPRNACSASGYNSGSTLPSRTWVQGDDFSAYVIAHELGHNFGLLHSQTIDCGASVLGGTCVTKSYGDPADTMGYGATPHFNAFQKELLGWLGGSGQPPITRVTSSGTYAIGAYAAMGPAPRALKIPKGIDPATGRMTHYYVEYRQPIGSDAVLADFGNLTQGVLLHTGVEGDGFSSFLLDTTPDSVPASTYSDVEDGALGVGRRYTDDAAGISIRVVSADAGQAVVEVLFAAQAPAPASGTLTESVATDKAVYLRGDTVRMSALVKRDAVPLAGATVTFTVTTPGGAQATLTATSGSDGYARGSYRLAKGKSAVGSYGLRADASMNGAGATASNAFSVR